jgi:hypothetical protein
MPALIDITGQRFGRLSIIRRAGRTSYRQATWECLCTCGVTIVATGSNLKSGTTKSCGCLKSATTVARNMSRRLAYSAVRDDKLTYQVWQSMIARCYLRSHPSFSKYGQKGVYVCDEWRTSFENFIKYVGTRPSIGHSIDRFPNQTGNYAPGNVRWATSVEQARNRKTNVLITHNGETRCIAAWAEIVGVGKATIAYRKRAGWTDSGALTVVPNHNNRVR